MAGRRFTKFMTCHNDVIDATVGNNDKRLLKPKRPNINVICNLIFVLWETHRLLWKKNVHFQ